MSVSCTLVEGYQTILLPWAISPKLQKDLTKLREWAQKLQMNFSVGKCKVIYQGKTNLSYTYTIPGSALAVIAQERDLRVVVDSSLKAPAQCAEVITKANKMLGIFKNGIENKAENS